MSLEQTYSPTLLLADGTNRTWGYGFKVRSTDDLKLKVISADGIVSDIASIYWTVDGTNKQITYPLSPNASLASGYKVLVLRNTPLGQSELVLQNVNSYSPAAVETALDITNMRIQEARYELTRASLVPYGRTGMSGDEYIAYLESLKSNVQTNATNAQASAQTASAQAQAAAQSATAAETAKEAAEAAMDDKADLGEDGIVKPAQLPPTVDVDASLQSVLKTNANVRMLLKITAADGIKDISANPVTASYVGSLTQGTGLYPNTAAAASVQLKVYASGHIEKPSGADWGKLNIGTGDFTFIFSRKCSHATNSKTGRIWSINQSVSNSNSLLVSGAMYINDGATHSTPEIAITANALEYPVLTRKNGVFKYGIYHVATQTLEMLGSDESVLKNVALNFGDFVYGLMLGVGSTTTDYIGGVFLSAKAEDYPSDWLAFPVADPLYVRKELGAAQPANYTQVRESGVSVVSTAAETSVINTAVGIGTPTIAANKLIVGDVIKIRAMGVLGTDASAPTATIKFKYGTTELISHVRALPSSLPIATTGFEIEAFITVLAVGASGKMRLNGKAWFKDNTADSGGLSRVLNGSVVSVDTTTDKALDATYTFSAASANNNLTVQQLFIETKIRPS